MSPLAVRLNDLLAGRPDLEATIDPRYRDERDALLALGMIHDLHLGPLSQIGERATWQHNPAVAALKQRLEKYFLAGLDAKVRSLDLSTTTGHDLVQEVRNIASLDLVPEAYRWLAEEASLDELRWFVALEGGPDGGFDDLVALCQVGLEGEPKMELARNYWDEMGQGDPAKVHTELLRRLETALRPPRIPPDELPLEALRRTALTGVLATNRSMQPELIGALGTIEMQAGPRSQCVVQAMHRLGLGDHSVAFYQEHAEADPYHGKDWLTHVIGPLASDPEMASGILCGAQYRCVVNREFFSYVVVALSDRKVA